MKAKRQCLVALLPTLLALEAPTRIYEMTGDFSMYAGAIAVIVAVGCVVELVEGRAECRRSKKEKAKHDDFPGFGD